MHFASMDQKKHSHVKIFRKFEMEGLAIAIILPRTTWKHHIKFPRTTTAPPTVTTSQNSRGGVFLRRVSPDFCRIIVVPR